MYPKTYDMGYEINISKNGKHYFATADRSLGHDIKKTKQIYQELKSLYPEDKGFKLSVTLWNHVGSNIDMEEELMTGELTAGL